MSPSSWFQRQFLSQSFKKGVSSNRECGLWGRCRASAVRERLPWGYVLWGSGNFEHVSCSPVHLSPDSPSLLDTRGQFLHKVVHRAVLADQARDLRSRVNDGRVVASTELASDLWQRGVCQFAREVHRDLAWVDDVLGAALTAELFHRKSKAVGYGRLDSLDRDLGRLTLGEDVLEHILREVDGHRPARQAREGDDARESALELADVRRDPTGDEREHLWIGYVNAVGLHLLAQARDPGLEVGRLDVRDQAPLEPRAEPLFERRDLARRPIGGDHDLAPGLVERVEGVEELLLDPFLVLEELDVVDQEQVVGAVALLEAFDPLVAQ